MSATAPPSPPQYSSNVRRLLTRLLAASLLSGIVFNPVCATATPTGRRQNILFILLDDAGMADFQSTDPMMRTPNIQQLLAEGLFLNQSYVYPACTPTRSAILTGRYAHTFGEQKGLAGLTTANFWLNNTLANLPKEMKALGYVTHMAGLWHLHASYCHSGLTPVGLGFDTFYGTLLETHRSHFYHHTFNTGDYDWWDGDTMDTSANGTYAAELVSDRMVRIIEESAVDKPFFAYMVFFAPHIPLEAPQRYVDRYCSHVAHEGRKIKCATLAAVDEGIGRMRTALREKEIYDDTAFIILSDNGGNVENFGSNYPLRAGKRSLYEGGTRSYTVVKAPGLAKTGTTWPGLMHVVDWLPTLVGMAGGKGSKDLMNQVHGINLWDDIRNFGASSRNEFLYAYDCMYEGFSAAYRLGDWKLIKGRQGFGLGWYPSFDKIASGEAIWEDVPPLENYDGHYELYNIRSDPYERHDLASTRPDKVQEIAARMEAFMKDYPLQPYTVMKIDEVWNRVRTQLEATRMCWCRQDGMRVCSAYQRTLQ